MTIAEYLHAVASTNQPEWRLGQTYFNILVEAHPSLAERVRSSQVDPFYRDDRIGEFLAFVSDNWDEATA